MNGFPATSPHNIGVIIAVAGFVALLLWTKRISAQQKLGNHRWLFFSIAATALLAVGVFGNGVSGTAGRGLIREAFMPHENPPHRVEALEQAIEVSLSDEFLTYYTALHGQQTALTGTELRSKLEFQRLPYHRLREFGITMTPPPSPDREFVLYKYYDVENFAFHMMKGCADPISHVSLRHEFLERLENYYAKELQPLSLLQMAKTDEQKIECLKVIRRTTPTLAEWTERKLMAFKKQTTLREDVTAELDATLRWLREYKNNPEARGLPAATKVPLD